MQTTRQNDQLCHNCSYDANPATTKHCIVCGHPLKVLVFPPNRQQSKQSLAIPKLPWLVAGSALGLLLLVGSIYFAKKSLTPAPVAVSQAERISGVQLYSAMRDVQAVPSGLFNYTGGVTFASLNSGNMIDAISRSHPNFRLLYTEPKQGHPGTTEGIAMLLDSEVSFAQASRPLKDSEYSKAKDRSIELLQIPVFIDGITAYVHRDIPISGLSRDQLQGIFLGKVTNWQQVGGPNLPIVPISQDAKYVSMVNDVLADQKAQGLGRNVRVVRDVTTAFQKVAATPGGISFATAAEVARQQSVRPLGLARPYSKNYIQTVLGKDLINYDAIRDGTYPLTRRLFIVLRRDGSLDEQAGLAYTNLLLSDEGQNLIQEAGFVPLR
jgi:phosphate transport system substrate-binding protein